MLTRNPDAYLRSLYEAFCRLPDKGQKLLPANLSFYGAKNAVIPGARFFLSIIAESVARPDFQSRPEHGKWPSGMKHHFDHGADNDFTAGDPGSRALTLDILTSLFNVGRYL